MFEHVRAKRLIGVRQNVGKYAEKAHHCEEIYPGRTRSNEIQHLNATVMHSDPQCKASHAEIDKDKLLEDESVDRTVTTKGYSKGSFEPIFDLSIDRRPFAKPDHVQWSTTHSPCFLRHH